MPSGTSYPGEYASSDELVRLADLYRDASRQLGAHDRRTDRSGPFRLVTIHAIELYLNAWLLRSGMTAAEIRGLQHDLSRRVALAGERGLVLRRNTAEHLEALTTRREYLTARYMPDCAGMASQINRLEATLEQLHRCLHEKRPAPSDDAQAA